MGEIFHAIVYDKDAKTCWMTDADKFHANCYSYSGVVMSVHYLLRQKANNTMWGGGHVVIDDRLEEIDDTDILLGISTYVDYRSFEQCKGLSRKSYYGKVKTIDENSKLWRYFKAWDEAIAFFKNNENIQYTGFLLNHSQRLAVDLADFYERSKSLVEFRDGSFCEMVIDPVPVLTETGKGSLMAFFEGISWDTTEKLAATWCGNLLQITSELPEDYRVIDCCFANVWSRADYLHQTFGLTKDGFIIRNRENELFEATVLNFSNNRSRCCNIKAEETDKGMLFSWVPVEES